MNAGTQLPEQALQQKVRHQEEHYNFWNNVWAFLETIPNRGQHGPTRLRV